jgi:hypothetical protein
MYAMFILYEKSSIAAKSNKNLSREQKKKKKK